MQKTLRCLLVSGLIVVGASSKSPVHAVPFPVTSSEAIADSKPITQVWHYGWGGGAVLAGAAIGLFAGAALASSAYPYGYYGYPYYRAYYPAYYPSWGYRRIYYARPYWGYRRAYYGRPYWDYRRAYYGGYRRAYWQRVGYRRAYGRWR